MKTILLLFTLIFSNQAFSQALQTGKKIEETLKTWVGSTEAQLIQSWGTPTSSHKLLNGDTVLQYDDRTNVTSVWYCKIDFILDNKGIVKSWRWEGNNCDR